MLPYQRIKKKQTYRGPVRFLHRTSGKETELPKFRNTKLSRGAGDFSTNRATVIAELIGKPPTLLDVPVGSDSIEIYSIRQRSLENVSRCFISARVIHWQLATPGTKHGL